MEIRIDELEQIKVQLEDIIMLMEEKGIETLSARSNTYGIHDNFIGFVSKGYISLEETIYELEEE